MVEKLSLILSAILVNNVIFARFLGTCPYLGVSKSIETARGMSIAVAFVMTLSVAATWPIQKYILLPNDLSYLQTIVFILVIAALVQFVELVMKKLARKLFESLGIYLPLITTNCAILGVAILCVSDDYSFIDAMIFSISSAVGFGLAIIIFAGIRTRFEMTEIPRAFKGASIGLITAGILSLAFLGFSNLV